MVLLFRITDLYKLETQEVSYVSLYLEILTLIGMRAYPRTESKLLHEEGL
jgi:hypothetical protein